MKHRKQLSPMRLWMVILAITIAARADTVIARNGASYTGHFLGATGGTMAFTDTSGIQYTFPLHDVQSLVFTTTNDTITLRNGKVYSGKYTGADPLSFKDTLGILYRFPRKDLESLVLSEVATEVVPPKEAKVIATGTEIQIRTNETIDSDSSSAEQLFSAEVTEAVDDLSGTIGIPAHSPAKLLILSMSSGHVSSPDLVLDLDSVTINGHVHRVYTSELKESNRKGVGENKRTAELLGGGAAIGSLVGAIFGGGRGAAIGAGGGAGGGFLTEILTRGKHVKVPAETVLRFRLEKPLVLQPD
jgi:hypothetical protein